MKLRSLMFIVPILVLLHGYVHAESKSKKFGIGLRYGYVQDGTHFQTESGETYIKAESSLHEDIRRFPLILQFEEELLTNWAITKWLIHIDDINNENSPPVLEGLTYEELISQNTDSTGKTRDINVSSDQTKLSKFLSEYKRYQSLVDAANEPSLSAAYNIRQVMIGKNWGIFFPVSDRHRLLQIGAGFGLGYLNGNYEVKLCDPFIIKGEEIKGFTKNYREVLCNNKTKLFSETVSNISLGMNFDVYLYSFIGETYIFNLGSFDLNSSFYKTLTYDIKPLMPTFTSVNTDLFSVVYQF